MSTPSNNERKRTRRPARRSALDADAAYENAHLIARDLLVRIEELLFDMPAPTAKSIRSTGATWGASTTSTNCCRGRWPSSRTATSKPKRPHRASRWVVPAA